MLNTTTSTSFTAALGLRGWGALEPALLASLATQAPLLLIGPHGVGKSELVEKTAQALGQPCRHYNASLINYDDLVGIPMPNQDATALEFLKSPGNIWSASFVFLDEISRCRADLQNRLFSIIHERRVLGIDLENLQHRWAAMNPPAPDELDTASKPSSYYLGSEPLDPALTDRFPYILSVPTWVQLSPEDRREAISWRGDGPVTIDPTLDLPALVEETAALIPELEATFHEWLGDYIVCLMDLLEQNGLGQSTRRGYMLARSVVAIHAARMVLEDEDADPEISAEYAVRFGMPETATDTPPSTVKLVAIHKQAWELAQYMENDAWRQVIQETDPARRVALADDLGFDDEDMSQLVTHVLSAEDSNLRQVGLAVGMFMKFRDSRNLDPSAFEPLSQLAYHMMQPVVTSYTLQPNTPQLALWNEIDNWIKAQGKRALSDVFRLQRNFLLYGFPETWEQTGWQDALRQFTEDLRVLGVHEDA
jgi:MoxR-like ATPase